MKIQFTTESGSTYIIDNEAMTWERVIPGPGSVNVRTKGGPLYLSPSAVIGYPCIIVGPPLTEGADFRYIQTTPVTSITELKDNA